MSPVDPVVVVGPAGSVGPARPAGSTDAVRAAGPEVVVPPVPAPAGRPGSLGPQVVGALTQSATAMHISTRSLFYAAQPPPRNPIIVSDTSPVESV